MNANLEKSNLFNSILGSFSWIFLTTFFSLLQLWIIIGDYLIRKDINFDINSIFLSSVLLFFSSTLVISIMIDYRLLEKHKPESKILNELIYFIPFFILFICILNHLQIHYNDSKILKLNLIKNLQLLLFSSSILYAFMVKFVQYLTREDKV